MGEDSKFYIMSAQYSTIYFKVKTASIKTQQRGQRTQKFIT